MHQRCRIEDALIRHGRGRMYQSSFNSVKILILNNSAGYGQVPIFPPHQTYLGLSFEHDDLSVSYWVWVVMPLGIVDAAHIFTALTDPLMDCILLKGMRANIYIDDLLSICQGFANAVIQDKAIRAYFYEGGWVFKPSKSSGPPSQRVTYLGLVINSLDMIFEIPADKMVRLLEGAKFLLSARRFLVKTLASWVGLLQSVRLAVGPVVSIMCRSLYDCIKAAKYWSSYIKLSDLAKFQLQWWVDNLPSLDGYPICQDSSVIKFEFSVSGDASDRGFFMYKVESRQKLFSRAFTVVESQESSTFKELTAVHETWTNPNILIEYANKTVGHYTDNKAVSFILAGGSRQPKLQKLALEVFLALRKFNIVLVPIWVSRDNEIISWADRGSRDFRSDDYSLDPVTMSTLESKFGKFSVDCMASSTNAICGKFFSRFSSPGSAGIDFFAQTLRQEDFHFCFPPVRKAVDAIKHLALFKVAGILVIPVWPRSQIFNYFFPDGTHTPDWVLSLELLDPSFISGQSVGPCFKGIQSFKTVALKFNFQNNYLSFVPKVRPDFCLKQGCENCL